MKADASGADDGSSWIDAFDDLQDALDVAAPGDEIWVVAGRYVPSRPFCAEPLCVAFSLLAGVSLFGGFAGSEDSRNERDIRADTTVLDGDLLGDDTATEGRSENAVHVLVALDPVDEGTVLNGFYVRSGNATSSSAPGPFVGASLYVVDGHPTITNCAFIANFCRPVANNIGAAINFEGGSPSVSRCDFRGNGCAGVGTLGSTDLVVEECLFRRNSGVSAGVTINETTGADVRDCRFADSRASVGGGVRSLDSSAVRIARCVSRDLDATGGGGVNFTRSSDCLVRECSFRSCRATGGGSVRIASASGCVVRSCAFRFSGATGGAAFDLSGSTDCAVVECDMRDGEATDGNAIDVSSGDRFSIVNCVVANGSSGPPGSSAVSVRNCPKFLVAHCTIVSNDSNGFRAASGSGVAMVDSISFSNAAAEILVDFDAAFSARFSDIQGGWPGDGHLDANPGFVSPGTGDFHLLGTSPCVDAGDDASLPADAADLDDDGDGGVRVDMGAFERQGG